MRYSILPHHHHSNFIQQAGSVFCMNYQNYNDTLDVMINILLIRTLGFSLLFRFVNRAFQIQGSGHSSKNNEFTESSVEEALDIESGALMIWSVIEKWLKGGREEREELWSRILNRLLLPTLSPL